MFSRFRPRLTYANVMATLALFVALGGGAYAATSLPAKSVGTTQLKKGAVTTPKLADGAVTAAKVKPGSLTGALFAPGSLTGTQVNASTLGTVPQANHAANADQLGGASPSAYQARVSGSCPGKGAITAIRANGTATCTTGSIVGFAPPTGSFSARGIGNLSLAFYCHDSNYNPQTFVEFRNTTGSDATVNWLYSNGSAVSADGVPISPYKAKTFSYVGKRIEGQFIYSAAGQETTVNLHAVDLTSSCEVRGTAETDTNPQ
jgi:hypothetical protein